jgi:hypothetical protein
MIAEARSTPSPRVAALGGRPTPEGVAVNRTIPTIRALALALLLAAPAAAYTVFLRDGSKIAAREEYVIEGDKAIITLQNGTRTSISASEIDVERTRRANQTALGAAELLDDGSTTALPTTAAPPPKRERLSDLIAKRDARNQSQLSLPAEPERETVSKGPVADYRQLPPRPFASSEVAEEVQRLFRAQGVDQLVVRQGSRPDHLLLEVTANSEAAVFRSLEVAASSLLHLVDLYPGEVRALELALETFERESAGQFLISADAARLLTERGMEPSTFFVRQVRF